MPDVSQSDRDPPKRVPYRPAAGPSTFPHDWQHAVGPRRLDFPDRSGPNRRVVMGVLRPRPTWRRHHTRRPRLDGSSVLRLARREVRSIRPPGVFHRMRQGNRHRLRSSSRAETPGTAFEVGIHGTRGESRRTASHGARGPKTTEGPPKWAPSLGGSRKGESFLLACL